MRQANIRRILRGPEECVAVPRRLLEKFLDDRLDACKPDERLVVMAQNPGDHFHWSKSVTKHISASDLQDLAECLANQLLPDDHSQ